MSELSKITEARVLRGKQYYKTLFCFTWVDTHFSGKIFMLNENGVNLEEW